VIRLSSEIYVNYLRAKLKYIIIKLRGFTHRARKISVRIQNFQSNLGIADASAVYDPYTDYAYVSCGYMRDFKSYSNHIYRLEDGDSIIEFKPVTKLDSPRWGAIAVRNPLDGTILFIGGYFEGESSSMITVFDPLDKEVYDINVKVPIGRGCMAEFIPEWGSILIASEHPRKAFFIYNCSTRTLRSVDCPWSNMIPRWGSMAYYKSLLFITGGSISRPPGFIVKQPFMRVFKLYNRFKLDFLESMVTPFALHGMNREPIVYNDFIIMGFGLDDFRKFHNQIFIYDVREKTYHYITSDAKPRDGVASAFNYKRNRVYFIGGRNTCDNPHGLHEITIMDLSSKPIDVRVWAEPYGDNRYAIIKSDTNTFRLHIKLTSRLERIVQASLVILRDSNVCKKREIQLHPSEEIDEEYVFGESGFYRVMVSLVDKGEKVNIETNTIHAIKYC